MTNALVLVDVPLKTAVSDLTGYVSLNALIIIFFNLCLKLELS
jgi:hypothetical protein